MESQIEELGRITRQLLDSYAEKPNWKAPSQRDLDDIWHRFYGITQQYWISTYSEYKEGKRGQEFPGWEALGE